MLAIWAVKLSYTECGHAHVLQGGKCRKAHLAHLCCPMYCDIRCRKTADSRKTCSKVVHGWACPTDIQGQKCAVCACCQAHNCCPLWLTVPRRQSMQSNLICSIILREPQMLTAESLVAVQLHEAVKFPKFPRHLPPTLHSLAPFCAADLWIESTSSAASRCSCLCRGFMARSQTISLTDLGQHQLLQAKGRVGPGPLQQECSFQTTLDMCKAILWHRERKGQLLALSHHCLSDKFVIHYRG